MDNTGVARTPGSRGVGIIASLMRCGCVSRLRKRYREWNRSSYRSRFERRLNRSLWALLVIAVVYSVLQHVVLANVPEVFPSGARWGDPLTQGCYWDNRGKRVKVQD